MAAITREVTVGLDEGLDARQTAKLVQLVCRFSTETVSIDYNGKVINPKSLMASMYLTGPKGAVYSIRAEGPAAEEAADAIEKFLKG